MPSLKKHSRKSLILLLIVFGLLFICSLVTFIFFKFNTANNEAKLSHLSNERHLAQSAATNSSAYDVNGILNIYSGLYQQNHDLAGWLTIEETDIDYPVMQNGEYYLRRNFDKAYSNIGLPFIDSRCHVGASGENLIIYGHNLKDSGAFSSLVNYRDRDFFEQHETILFDTLTQQRIYKIVAVFEIDISQDNEFNIYDFTNSGDTDKVRALIEYIDGYSLYRNTQETIEMDEDFLTLSTCSTYYSDSERLVILAKKTQSMD